MPSVKTRVFKHTSKSGEVMEFKAPIAVDAKGEFTVNIPDVLAASAQALLNQPIWKTAQISASRARVNWRIQGANLSAVERFVEEAMKEHLTVDVTEELVIRYRYQNHTTGVIGADGEVHPNGQWVDRDKDWSWVGNKNIHAANLPALFAVGLVARVFKKVTYARPSGAKVEYTNDLPGSHFDRNPMMRLNGFIVRSPDYDGWRSGELLGSGNSPSDRVHEMSYSDAAADFFSDLMIAMFRLGEQLDNFVGNQENLLLAIEKGAGLLGGPANTSN